jgi:adenylate cyclase
MMVTITSDSGTFSALEQQLVKLAGMVDQVRTGLQRMPPNSVPTQVTESANNLANSLTKFGRQLSALEEERRNLNALAQTNQVINSSLELDEVLQIVMDTIIRLTSAERGFLMLRDEENEFVVRVGRNWEQETLDPSEFAISRTIIHRVANEGQPVLTTNAQEDPRFTGQQSVVAYNLRSILCVPLKVKDELLGVIYADSRIRSGLFTQKDLNLLFAFANQSAIAIDNARLFTSVRQTLAEVTELKNLMDNVFSSIVSGVITADVKENVLLANRAAEKILGSTSKTLVGGSLANMITSSAAAVLDPYLAQVLKTDKPVIGLEFNSELPNRGSVDLRFNLSPLKDAEQHTQGVAIVLDDLTERKHLEAQRSLFERMVSPAVIEYLDPNKLQLGGQKQEITTLFADIRGFTSYSETVSPEELVKVLNMHLAAAAEAVLFEDGTIDKFLGDAVMAWFNAPVPQKDHTLRAVRAALSIRQGLDELHRENPELTKLSFGVGIHVGDAVLGLVGTEKRLDYTAIGDSVNTAKRIQENSEAGQILISQQALAHVADTVVVEPVDPIHAKGKREPLNVYKVLRLR